MYRPRLTSLAACAAMACAPLAAVAATATASTTTTPRVTIVNCSGHEVARPASYVLACGDGNTALTHLRWSDWGSARATATGTEALNLCSPTCVAGTVTHFPVRVVAERLRGGRYREVVVTAVHGHRGTQRITRWTPLQPGQ